MKNILPVIDLLQTKTTEEVNLFKSTLEKEADEYYNRGELIGMETAIVVAQL